MIKTIDNFIFYLICLIPLGLVSGPFIPDALLVIVSLLFIVQVFYKKLYFYFHNRYSYIFIAYCIFIILCSLLSSNILLSLESSLFYFRFGIFALAVWYIIDTDPMFIRYFTYLLLGLFIILFIDGVYQYLTNYNFLGYHYGGNRLTSLFGEKKVLGNFLSRLLPLLVALLILQLKNTGINGLLILLLTLCSGFLISISGDRTGFVIYLFSVFTSFLLMNSWKKMRIVNVVLFSTTLIVIVFLDTNIYNRLINKTIFQIQGNLQAPDEKLYFLSKTHHLYLETSFKMFKENKIYGIGPKNYRDQCNNKKYRTEDIYLRSTNPCSTHPHNTYFQSLAETGIIGFIPIVTICFMIGFIFLRQFIALCKGSMYISDYKLFLYIALIITVLPLLPSLNFYNNWISIIYYLPIGFVLSAINSRTKL